MFASSEIVVATCILAIVAHKISRFPHHVCHNLQKAFAQMDVALNFEIVFLQKLFLR